MQQELSLGNAFIEILRTYKHDILWEKLNEMYLMKIKQKANIDYKNIILLKIVLTVRITSAANIKYHFRVGPELRRSAVRSIIQLAYNISLS